MPSTEIIEVVGEVEELPLATLFTYPLLFQETDQAYLFKAGIVFNEPGRYYVTFSTNQGLYENYQHPAAYYCNDKRRQEIDVLYTNSSTNEEAYENIFLATGVDYLIQLMDYLRYASIGAHSFIVH